MIRVLLAMMVVFVWWRENYHPTGLHQLLGGDHVDRDVRGWREIRIHGRIYHNASLYCDGSNLITSHMPMLVNMNIIGNCRPLNKVILMNVV